MPSDRRRLSTPAEACNPGRKPRNPVRSRIPSRLCHIYTAQDSS